MATKGTLKYRKVTRTPQSGPNADYHYPLSNNSSFACSEVK